MAPSDLAASLLGNGHVPADEFGDDGYGPDAAEWGDAEPVVYTEAQIHARFTSVPSRRHQLLQTSASNDDLSALDSDAPSARWRCLWESTAAALPILRVLQQYSLTDLQSDLVAGCTVSVVLIPQAIAYALLADLPPIYGLYCSVVPVLIYSLSTTSKHTCVGPFALVSMLVSDLLKGALPADLDFEHYIGAVMLLSCMTGLVQLAMGLCRAGFVVTFLGDSVVSGFTTGAAILIMVSQVKHLLGLDIQSSNPFAVAKHLVQDWEQINPYTAAISLCCVLGMTGLKSLNQKYLPKVIIPEQLVVVVLFTALSWALSLHAAPYGVKCLGAVEAKLPAFAPPPLDLATARKLVQPAIITAIISYMVTISIAQSLAAKHGEVVDANQELRALGCSNLAGAFFQAYPCSGSLSRSAVCSVAGGRTQAHGMVQFTLVAATLATLMPALAPLPYPALASVVIMALKTMVDFSKGKRLHAVSQGDFHQWLVACLATILLGVQDGIVLGMAGSMVWLVKQTSRPFWAELGRLPNTRIYRNVRAYPGAQQLPGILIFRFDGSLHFANKDYFCEALTARERRYPRVGGGGGGGGGLEGGGAVPGAPLRYVVLEASSMVSMDAAGTAVIRALVEENRKREPPVELLFAGAKGALRRAFRKSGLEDLLGRGNMFLELHNAVMFAEGKVLAANLLEVPRSISATSSSGRLVEVEGADADVARL